MKNTNMKPVGQVLEMARRVLYPSLIPLILLGAPGIAKTALVVALAKVLGLRLVTIIAPSLEGVDINGFKVPLLKDGEWILQQALPELAPGLSKDEPFLLLIEEIGACPYHVQPLLSKLMFPDAGSPLEGYTYWCIATGNRAQDHAGSDTILAHTRLRSCVVEVCADVKSWILWASKQTDLHPLAVPYVSLISEERGHLFSTDPDASKQTANPRSLTRMFRAAREAEATGIKPTDPVLFQVFQGLAGEETARAFQEYIALGKDLPTPASIRDGSAPSISALRSDLHFACSWLCRNMIAANEFDAPVIDEWISNASQVGPLAALLLFVGELKGGQAEAERLLPRTAMSVHMKGASVDLLFL